MKSKVSKPRGYFRYGTTSITRPTSRKTSVWIYILILASVIGIGIVSDGDSNLSAGYTADGGKR